MVAGQAFPRVILITIIHPIQYVAACAVQVVRFVHAMLQVMGSCWQVGNLLAEAEAGRSCFGYLAFGSGGLRSTAQMASEILMCDDMPSNRHAMCCR